MIAFMHRKLVSHRIGACACTRGGDEDRIDGEHGGDGEHLFRTAVSAGGEELCGMCDIQHEHEHVI